MPDDAAAPPISTVDVLTPIHNGLRAMIYDLGGRLLLTDFADPAATDRLLVDLDFAFGAGVPAGCLLCLLHAHAGHEDEVAFPPARRFDARLVDALREDHHRFTRDLARVQERAAPLRTSRDASARRAAGRALTLALDDFFARYLAHLHREETELVPLLNRHFTDAELLGWRATVERSMAPERLRALQGWIVRAMDAAALAATLRGILAGPPAERDAQLAVVRAAVDPARWRAAAAPLGLA